MGRMEDPVLKKLILLISLVGCETLHVIEQNPDDEKFVFENLCLEVVNKDESSKIIGCRNFEITKGTFTTETKIIKFKIGETLVKMTKDLWEKFLVFGTKKGWFE